MPTPQQQVIDKTKACFARALELYGLDLSRVAIRFDLKGRAAGQASRRGFQYAIRFNHDMLHREAFDHVLNNTAPHEVAHIVCFMNPQLGRNHDRGWERVCRQLGGTGATRHNEDVIHGKGTTYEYTTSTGKTVRVGDKHHKIIQAGRPLTWKRGLGTVTRESAYSIVGVNGRTLATPVVKTPTVSVAPVQVINPIVTAARTTHFIGAPVAPVVRTPAPVLQAGLSKAAMSRAIMLSGHTAGRTYEQIIDAMIAACGYDRQLARATYKANADKVGVPQQ